MRFRRTALLGLVGSAFIATNAMAADVPPVVVAPLPPPVAAGFDWDGAYVGVSAGAFAVAPPTVWLFGVGAGYNLVIDGFFVGAEAKASVFKFFPGGPLTFSNAQVRARVGILAGDNALVYALAGVGWGGAPIWSAGGGVEFGVGDSMSIRAEAYILRAFGGGGPPAVISLGVNFHPGN